MGQTSKYNIRYPEAGDMADVPADMKNMAEDIETAMGGKLSKTGDTMSGNLTMSNAVIKITNGGEKGIRNESGMAILCDFANQNVTLDATGKELFLGYRNTTGINFLNYKVAIDSNGNVAANNFKGKWDGYMQDIATENTSDTWLLVTNKGKVQHRTIANIIDSFALNKKYSTSETSTGETWVDGKTIYQKTVKITSLNSNRTYTHGISNFGELIDIRGTGYWSGQGWQPIQRVVTDGIAPYGLGLGDINATKFMLQVGSSYSGFQKAYITLKYTKK